jgi:hypothetical protein
MAISAVADDAFEGRLDRTDRLGVEQARFRTRMLGLTDHERYEADWPTVGSSRELGSRPRRSRRVATR